jgi:hypothetical protein
LRATERLPSENVNHINRVVIAHTGTIFANQSPKIEGRPKADNVAHAP